MSIIRQQSLFGIQELYEMEPTHRYEAIISAINLDAIYHEVTKKSRLGAPQELNYAAMILSVFIRYVERIPTIKDLIFRIENDISFKLNSCRTRQCLSKGILSTKQCSISYRKTFKSSL